MYQVVIPGCGRGACTAMSILFFFFPNWGFLFLSGVRTFLIGV